MIEATFGKPGAGRAKMLDDTITKIEKDIIKTACNPLCFKKRDKIEYLLFALSERNRELRNLAYIEGRTYIKENDTW